MQIRSNFYRSLTITLSASLLVTLFFVGATPAAAQDDDHRGGLSGDDHRGGFGGLHGGFGTGLAIGIGGALLQGMASHPPTDTNLDQPSTKRSRATRKDATTSPQHSRRESNDKSGAKPNSQRGSAGGGGVPPRGERHYIADEVLTQFAPTTSQPTIDQIARRYNLTLLESQDFSLLGGMLYRWRFGGRRPLADVIGALEQERAVASAQPNYVFTLQDETVKIADAMAGDPAQYALAKLRIREAHQFAAGKQVTLAVIDSEVDVQHPDLTGTVVKTFDALGGNESPHKHGTGMAGAIAAHGRLLGSAPDVQLLTARAFDDSAEAKGTSFAIYKSVQWAADNGARIVNMSFSGPSDPAMHRMLVAAYGKDLVLVSAAGNAGPKSDPLYPAAESEVIAVTATDNDDAVFKMANRGDYIAVAAPGVDVLVTGPAASYGFTTGTSVAAAEVSGIVALLLERNPALKPKEIRSILTSSATPIASNIRHEDFGAGLANAYQAVISLASKTVGGGEEAGQLKR